MPDEINIYNRWVLQAVYQYNKHNKFWSAELDAWVNLFDATIYTDKEKQKTDAGFFVEWVQLPDTDRIRDAAYMEEK